MKCKKCGNETLVKNGRREGKQCYLCRECRHQFTSEHGRHSKQDEALAALLYRFGLPLASIAQLMFIHPSTALRWVRKHTEESQKQPAPQNESAKTWTSDAESDIN